MSGEQGPHKGGLGVEGGGHGGTASGTLYGTPLYYMRDEIVQLVPTTRSEHLVQYRNISSNVGISLQFLFHHKQPFNLLRWDTKKFFLINFNGFIIITGVKIIVQL